MRHNIIESENYSWNLKDYDQEWVRTGNEMAFCWENET